MKNIEPSEKEIQNSIITYLNYSGKYHVWRVNSGAIKANGKDGKQYMVRLARVGSSDIMGVERGTGKMVAIEVKRPSTRNSLTPAQEGFLTMIKDYGGIAFVATSIDDVEDKLKEIL